MSESGMDTGSPIRIEKTDAFGAELLAYLAGKDRMEIVERDDGFIDCNPYVAQYFAPYTEWPEHERLAVHYAHGKVVDVGCGAGRVSLYLQEKGCRVTGIDVSPGALEIARRRGVSDVRNMPFAGIGPELGTIDSWILYGNNFGLFGSRARARRLLIRMRGLSAAQDAIIIAESTDPYRSDDPDRLAYNEFNRRRNRMPGQQRLRVRHRRFITPWFDYLLVSRTEMEEIVAGTGWKPFDFVDGPYGAYIAVLKKDRPAKRRAKRND